MKRLRVLRNFSVVGSLILSLVSFVKIGASEANFASITSSELKAIKNVLDVKLNKYPNRPDTKLAKEILWLVDVCREIQETSLLENERNIYKQIINKINADFKEAQIVSQTQNIYSIDDTFEVKSQICEEIGKIASIISKVTINRSIFLKDEHTLSLIEKRKAQSTKIVLNFMKKNNSSSAKASVSASSTPKKSNVVVEDVTNEEYGRGQMLELQVTTGNFEPKKGKIVVNNIGIIEQLPNKSQLILPCPSRPAPSVINFPEDGPFANNDLQTPNNSHRWLKSSVGYLGAAILYGITKTETFKANPQLQKAAKVASALSFAYGLYKTLTK